MRRRFVPLRSLTFALLLALSAAHAAADPPRPLYYSRELTNADLSGRSLRELTLLRNTIFARAGHTFRKDWLSAYFKAQPWYRPLAKDDESKITPIDRKNAALVARFDATLARAELLRRRDEVLARQRAGQASADDRIELRLLSGRLGEWLPDASPAASASEAVDSRSPLEDPALLERQLTTRQLANLSRRDLRMLRNTVYARRGRSFRSELLQSYFDQTGWYHGDPAYSDAKLTALDQRNIKLIRSVEDSLGGPLSDKDHKEEDGWLSGA